ncbi:MAG TPA: IPT/TIG domain-containing protein [Dinghuibacter sp.]|nr:IPT/TIG domain-containing protein [Dinghuibacter sp.]HTJ14152.1 IPT/TIG domain-containing protein [Dinghuibacter sp.]
MVHNAAGYASLNGFSYVGKNVPTLTSFWNHGIVGGQININGSNFTGATAVYFGAVPATSFRVYNDGLIFAQVPPGANNVPITVATPNGTVTSSRNFLVDPTLTSISPQTDTTGGVVTIQGYGLSTARQVYFGAVPAASFSIVNDTVIQATVGSGASGYVSVYSRLADSTSFQDTLYSQSFYFGSPLIPIINSFSPESDTLGGTVTIKGAHLTGATVVKLAGSPASSFAVISDSLITAVVGPTGNGPVTVLTPHGTATSADAFSYFGVPADIFDFYPKSDTAGQIITLTGKHLTGVWYIAVGDGWTETVNVLSDSVLQFAVPHGATSGAISIEAQGGYISSINGFVYGTMPAISSFSPVSDTARGTVTIHGYQFTGATAVSFGNTPAASYTVVSDTLIHAIVGAGSSGLVKVTTPQGSDSLAGFTYVAGPAPKIDTLYNMYGNAGQFVQIYGQNIGNATAVTFGGTPAASFQVINSGIVVARLGSGSSGWVTVTTPYGRDSFPNFWYVTGPPTLIGFYPQSATTGDTLRIVGNNLVGPTQVLLGGKPAKVIYSDPGQVNVVVRDGATGSVEFDNGYGSVAMPGFVYTGTVPSLITVTPTSDSAGKTVTLTGQRLSGATALNFGAVPAASFTVVSDSVITAIVPTGVTSHYIGVTTPGGVDSLGGFTYLGAATPPPPPVNPVIASFYPTTDTAGGTVTIHGSDFTGVNLVTFGGVPAASFTVVSDSTINAVVGNGASGSIIVFSAHGNDTTWGFTLAQSNQHSISYLSPGSDTVGGQVTITGLGFFGVSNVLFGSTPATFSVTSPTSIIATVPNGLTTGSYTLSVIMPGDTLTFNSFTVIDTIMPPAPQPQLFSFSPASDTAGGTVTLYGAHLTGASQVTFGGTPAASISVVSDSIVTAVVGQGSTGAIWLTTSGGTAKTDTLTPFTYVPKTVISPTITSFTPIIDTAGGVVTITGTNLGDVQWVYFGSTPAASFTVVSPTTITAVLGDGSTGAIQVGNSVTNAYSVDTFLFVGAKPPFAVTSFTGAMVSNQAQLTWITQYDQGVATYTLESSADSISFNQVYSVPSRHIDGAGNAYSFVDPNPVQGMNYYLLTAIDSLGNTLGTWRTTLNVPIQPQVTTLPNPASGAINIQVPYSAHTATLTLVDLNGKPVRTMTVPSGAYQARMDLTGVPGGIYVLTWQDGTNRTEKHIMVQ